MREAGVCLALVFLTCGILSAAETIPGPPFRFDRDTFAFANETVLKYENGHPSLRRGEDKNGPPRFMRRCFVMCRTADQFRKFARFDPTRPPPDDRALAKLVRDVTRHPAWRGPLPQEQRTIIPGYADLRALSAAREGVVQQNIGIGWTTYIRPGNYRMAFFFLNGGRQQAGTHAALERALDRNDVFIGYLTTFPHLTINHATLVYARQPASGADAMEHYLAYDPNHPEASRDLSYDPRERAFSYQKDWDFVGGKVTMLQIFGHPVQ